MCWGKLKLNSAGHRPSRIKFDDLCNIQWGIVLIPCWFCTFAHWQRKTWWPRNVWPLWLPTRVLGQILISLIKKQINVYIFLNVFFRFFFVVILSHCSNKRAIKILYWSTLCQWVNVQNQQGIKKKNSTVNNTVLHAFCNISPPGFVPPECFMYLMIHWYCQYYYVISYYNYYNVTHDIFIFMCRH